MTGFDETVPPAGTGPDEDAGARPDPDNDLDELAPEHDANNPVLDDDRSEDPEGAARERRHDQDERDADAGDGLAESIERVRQDEGSSRGPQDGEDATR